MDYHDKILNLFKKDYNIKNNTNNSFTIVTPNKEIKISTDMEEITVISDIWHGHYKFYNIDNKDYPEKDYLLAKEAIDLFLSGKIKTIDFFKDGKWVLSTTSKTEEVDKTIEKVKEKHDIDEIFVDNNLI